MTCVRIEFDYEVVNGEGRRLLAIGSTSRVWTDKLLRPLNIKKQQPEIWRILEGTLDLRQRDKNEMVSE